MASVVSRINRLCRASSSAATYFPTSLEALPSTSNNAAVNAQLRQFRDSPAAQDANGEPRFLVTGAGGQIGKDLLHLLRQEHDRCQALSHLKRMEPVNVVATDVRHSPGTPSCGPFAYCDVTDKDNIARLVVEHRITHIMHLATLLSAVGERNPQLALRVNMLGIQNVLEVAAGHNVAVFAPSTIAVFGSSTPKVLTPDETICEPSTMYGITKVHVELLGKYYADKFGVDFRSLRYPGIISSSAAPGGGTTDYSVEMQIAAVLGKDYVCPLAPDTPLPMMYMPDCLRATWDLITAPRTMLSRCTYNVTAMSFTPKELETSIRKRYPQFRVTYQPDFRQDIAASWPQSIDDSKARADWDWRPQFDLDAMTEDMLVTLAEKYSISEKAPTEGPTQLAAA